MVRTHSTESWQTKCPLVCVGISLLIVICYFIQRQSGLRPSSLDPFILGKGSWGWIGYMWLHLGIIHVLESLIMLWILGRKTAHHLGPLLFFLLFVTTGIGAAGFHALFDGRTAIGASGAWMGLLGIYATLFYRDFGRSGPMLLAIFIGLTIGFSISDLGPGAHLAHLGGFVTGVVMASLLMFLGLADSQGAHPDWQRWLKLETEFVPRPQTTQAD